MLAPVVASSGSPLAGSVFASLLTLTSVDIDGSAVDPRLQAERTDWQDLPPFRPAAHSVFGVGAGCGFSGCGNPREQDSQYCVIHGSDVVNVRTPGGIGGLQASGETLDQVRSAARINSCLTTILGGLILIAVVGVISGLIYQRLTEEGPLDSLGAGTGGGGGSASLRADASAFLRSGFSGSAEYAVISALEVRSGVLWITTSLAPGDFGSGTAVCGLGSAWAYGDPDAVQGNLWGVSVRARDGQRLVQRNGPSDTCQ